MQRITIGRLPEDPEVQGVVKPEDGSWQLIVDKEGFPHLWIRTKVENDDGTVVNGMASIEDFLPEGMDIKDLMLSTFSGSCEAPTDFEPSAPCPR